MADGSSAPDWRLAVDIGGTFTDVVLIDAASGRVVVDKTLTTPAAPLDGVRTGVRQLLAKAGVRPAEITAPIVHATTLDHQRADRRQDRPRRRRHHRRASATRC